MLKLYCIALYILTICTSFASENFSLSLVLPNEKYNGIIANARNCWLIQQQNGFVEFTLYGKDNQKGNLRIPRSAKTKLLDITVVRLVDLPQGVDGVMLNAFIDGINVVGKDYTTLKSLAFNQNDILEIGGKCKYSEKALSAGEIQLLRKEVISNNNVKEINFTNGKFNLSLTCNGSQRISLNTLTDSNGQSLLHASDFFWKITRLNGTMVSSSDMPGQVTTVAISPVESEVRIEWNNNQEKIIVIILLKPTRVEIKLTSTLTPCKEILFPNLNIAPAGGASNIAIWPRMSGVLYYDMPKSKAELSGIYPSASLTMQCFGSYDATQKTGLYFACEDPYGSSKEMKLKGLNGAINWQVVWSTGGNNFEIPGVICLQPITNGWYEVGQIYKHFVKTKSQWWPSSETREDTPAWYKNNIVNIRGHGEVNSVIDLARYLDVPTAYHWYCWTTQGHDRDYPNYTPKDDYNKILHNLQAAGIKVKPYINGRVWAVLDRGDTDYQYTTLALPNLVKSFDNDYYFEQYAEKFAVICPATKLWQNKMPEVFNQVADTKVDGIYIDQIAAGAPKICWATTHNHIPGDAKSWLTDGYWKILQKIYDERKRTYPNLAIETEDNAEAYLRYFDGFLPWRWVDFNQIPLFSSIYCGKIQFVGRSYEGDDALGRAAKLSQQLSNGEQLGWFAMPVVEIANPVNKDFSLFLKRVAHVRACLLDFFNNGEMLAPLDFTDAPKPVKSEWGYYGPRQISSPAIFSSVWRYQGIVAIIFVNHSDEIQHAAFKIAPETYSIESSAKIFQTKSQWQEFNAGTIYNISLPPKDIEICLITNNINNETCNKIINKFKQVKDFSYPSVDKWQEKPIVQFDKWYSSEDLSQFYGCAVLTRDGKKIVGGLQGACVINLGHLPKDFTGKTISLEIDMAAAKGMGGNGRLFLSGRGLTLAEFKVKITGGWMNFETNTIIFSLPGGSNGNESLILGFSGGAGSGYGNISRWRFTLKK